MKGAENILVRLVSDGSFAAAVWFGFVVGIPWAQHVVQFYVWVVVLPITLLMFHPELQKRVAAAPRPPRGVSVFRQMVAGGTLGILIWSGHLATAGAWAVSVFLEFVLTGAKKRVVVDGGM